MLRTNSEVRNIQGHSENISLLSPELHKHVTPSEFGVFDIHSYAIKVHMITTVLVYKNVLFQNMTIVSLLSLE